MKKKFLTSFISCIALVMLACFCFVGCGGVNCKKMRTEISNAMDHQYETDTPPALCTKEGLVAKYGEPQFKLELPGLPVHWVWFQGCKDIEEAKKKSDAGKDVPYCDVVFGEDGLTFNVTVGYNPKDIK